MSTLAIRPVISASNIFRRKLCPGSARMETGLADTDNDYSTEGTMLHALFLTGLRPPYLTPDQRDALDLADKLANDFFAKLCEDNQIPSGAGYTEEREQDMMLRGSAGQELYPGHADVIRTWPEYSVRGVVDVKFGFTEVEHAADNTQTASYAAMKQQSDPVDKTGVAIIQPRNFGPRSTAAIYDRSGIPKAVAELERIVAATAAPDAPLVPGTAQCQYCKAKAKCPAYLAASDAALYIGTRAVASLNEGELVAVHRAIQFANKIKDEVSEEMRRRVDAGTLPGWKLQNSGDVTVLDDSTGFYRALAIHFDGNPAFTAKAYDDCREMGWGKLVKLIQSITGLSEDKTKDFIKTMNEDFVTRTPKAMRVVQDKAKKLK